MSKLSRTAALDYISTWNTNEVIEFLKKNELEKCCHAVLKRQIDGDGLLHLTEGKLALWKSDLSPPQTCSLWALVQKLQREPEEHVAPQNISQMDPEPVSDSGSWGTDFEDEVDEDVTSAAIKKNNITRKDIPERSNDFRNSLMMFQRNEKLAQELPIPAKPDDTSPENLYMNHGWETEGEGENNYMNLEPETQPSQPPNSYLHNKFEKSLAEQLREQLKLLGGAETQPVKIMKKPEASKEKPARSGTKPPHTSFLHAHSVPNPRVVENKDVRKPVVPPPRPEKPPRAGLEKSDELPKPPVMLRNFDLVRDLPIKTDESDDEYEPFDEHIIEQNRIQMGSKQSLIQGSVESVYKPGSATSQDKEEYEIYEVITENPDSEYYIEPIVHPVKDIPPPLPMAAIISEPAAASTNTIPKVQKKRERSPEKKTSTLPHSGSVTSLSSEMRATRPLPPPPPFGEPYMDSPWFHNVTREQATALIKERACSNSHNGYFLLRPSTSDLNSPLVLVLWFKDRVYNVPVRKRPDSRYALGSLKINEQTFPSVEDIIKFHLREELLLYSGGAQMGSTKLTDTPPK